LKFPTTSKDFLKFSKVWLIYEFAKFTKYSVHSTMERFGEFFIFYFLFFEVEISMIMFCYFQFIGDLDLKIFVSLFSV